jgi:hypothetical protein
MATIINDSFMVCTDCLGFIADDDLTGLDYHYSKMESKQRIHEITIGAANADGVISVGNSRKDNEFSRSPCECCQSILAGSRHHCVVVGSSQIRSGT